MTAISNPMPSLLKTGLSPVPAEIVCHCLRISRDQIEVAMEAGAAESVKSIIRETGAGGGCTACHCTIRAMLLAAGHTVRCGTPQPNGCGAVPIAG